MNPKDILTNPCFCPMPWTGIMYNFDGKVKNCIRSEDSMPIGNIKDATIHDIVTGPENTARQQSICNKEPVPSCQPCYDLERGKKGFDIISDRVFYIKELKTTAPSTYTPGNFDLQTTDIRWSNLCNFACVYCSAQFSSKWADEMKVITQEPSIEQKEQFKTYILEHAHKLKHVYLAGGEPLLMKENLELLDRLDPNVNIRINTNLSKVDTSVFERVCEFKNVHWTISVETVEQEYEYIRYGGKWTDFLDNLSTIQGLNHKVTFNMLWFILNYKSIFGCVEFLQGQGFHNNSFVIGPVLNPVYLNIRNLPDAVLGELTDILNNKISQTPGYLLADSYKNMLHYISSPGVKDLSKSFESLAALDLRRGFDSSKIFTELYKFK